MEWQVIVALVIAIPIILFPVAFVWYLNIGGIAAAIKQAKEKRVALEKKPKLKEAVPQEQYEMALNEALKHYPWHQI